MQLGLLGPDGMEIDVEGYQRVPVEAGHHDYAFPVFEETVIITGWVVYDDNGATIATGGMGQGPVNLFPEDTVTVVLDLSGELPEPTPKPKKEGAPWWDRLAEDPLVEPRTPED